MTKDAWRDSFSRNAADLLAIYRWADGMTDEEFQHLLMFIFKRWAKRGARSEKINQHSVEFALAAREQVKAELLEGQKA